MSNDKTIIDEQDIRFNTGSLCCGHGDYRHEGGILVVRAYSSENYGYHNTYALGVNSVNQDTIKKCMDEGIKVERVSSMIDNLTQ